MFFSWWQSGADMQFCKFRVCLVFASLFVCRFSLAFLYLAMCEAVNEHHTHAHTGSLFFFHYHEEKNWDHFFFEREMKQASEDAVADVSMHISSCRLRLETEMYALPPEVLDTASFSFIAVVVFSFSQGILHHALILYYTWLVMKRQ